MSTTRTTRAVLALAALALGGVMAMSGAMPALATTESTVTLENSRADGTPTVRFDTDGDQIDAHDGQIQRFGDRYYLYGTSYGCGFRWNGKGTGAPFCGFVSYVSTDLVRWKANGPLFDASTPIWQQRCDSETYGCFRPHVVYNATTRKYVLWINSYDNTVGYHVFTSSRPDRGFTEVAVPDLRVPPGQVNVASYGDHQVFVDDDGAAYLAFTDWLEGGEIIVERLDADYTTGAGDPHRVGLVSTEAPTIFKRGATYYLTYSDPNRGYETTGTSYLTASSPLGPWHGTSETENWTVANGALHIVGGGVGLSRAGADWADYTVTAQVTPEASDQGYGQAGIVFRAGTDGSGYQWLFNNVDSPGRLTKLVPGRDAEQVDLPMAITNGTAYSVEIALRGSSIVTSIDGTVVDTTVDASLTRGGIGFREYDGAAERASVDSVRVTDPAGAALLTDDFSGSLSQWQPPRRVVGTKLTDTSCGGQPTDVLPIRSRTGTTYLYQSDRWVSRDEHLGNEALASQQWEPLRFDASGAIQPITCAAAPTVTVPIGCPGVKNRPRTVTSGDAGFSLYDDVSAGIVRQQSFIVPRSGRLTDVRLNAYRFGQPDRPLTITVDRLPADGSAGVAVASRTLDAADVPWSAKGVPLLPDHPVRVHRGDRLMITVRSDSDGSIGRYGIAYSDSSGFTGGEERYSDDGGASFRAESGRVLHFSADIR